MLIPSSDPSSAEFLQFQALALLSSHRWVDTTSFNTAIAAVASLGKGWDGGTFPWELPRSAWERRDHTQCKTCDFNDLFVFYSQIYTCMGFWGHANINWKAWEMFLIWPQCSELVGAGPCKSCIFRSCWSRFAMFFRCGPINYLIFDLCAWILRALVTNTTPPQNHGSYRSIHFGKHMAIWVVTL